MNISWLFILLLFSVQPKLPSQKAIDALNHMPYEQIVAKAALLDQEFIENAHAARQLGYVLGEAESYSHLSLIYYTQGKYAAELQYSLKAIALFERLNKKEKLALAYGELGYRMKRRDLKAALYYMQKAKRIAEQGKFTQPLLSIYNNYGVLKEMQQSLDSALYFYQKGLLLKESINDSVGLPYSLNNIAGVHLLRAEFLQAKPLFERALDIRMRRGDRAGIMESYSCFGDFYLMQNHPKSAILWFEKALAQAKQQGYVDFVQKSHRALSESYEMLGDNKQALRHFKAYSQFKDSLINTQTNNKIAELEIRFQTNEKEKEIAQNKNELLEKNIEVKNARYQMGGIGLVALFVSLLGYLLYRQQKLKISQQHQEFELKTAIARIETQNQLQEQRLDISRDLHDNIGAQLTFIISSVDNLKYAFDIQNPKLNVKLDNISAFTKSTIVELRDTIWAMNANDLSFEDLRSRMMNFIEKAQSAQEQTQIIFEIDPQLEAMVLSSVLGMNVYRTMQEAVNNALKYAQANLIRIEIKKTTSGFEMNIQDNGQGFDLQTVLKGNGLHNMQKRIERIGGIFNLTSKPGSGTEISFIVQC
ncbi:tetratricopeptide repeat protein [Flavobacterium sp. CYK-55]|uniref:tetratricopeptide repeat-containing sensor histidine kinase n=1 Tax=Flavobacterium sp. CYK-55 TaxID=2835529 RepID=UPI001BD074D0|nr:tetratricopeptide repeat protein [Flavobacterium sp. CYK-55]MBS7785732.1 tetratricopeptide repeat protein [Flavobacterium sp. CYK-55]